MKSLNALGLVFVSANLLGSATLVQAEALTRQQVKAELAEAHRNGTLIANSETLATYRDLNPDLYPTAQKDMSKTREQVKAELAEAHRNGTLIANSETLATYRDVNPDLYPPAPKALSKTREQVKAELAEAIRLGDVPIDEYGQTPAKRFPGTYAAVRAEHALAMKARRASQEAAQGTTAGTVLR